MSDAPCRGALSREPDRGRAARARGAGEARLPRNRRFARMGVPAYYRRREDRRRPGVQALAARPQARRREGARHPLLRDDQRRLLRERDGIPRAARHRRRPNRRLHTYTQVLRDVENILRYLRDDGVIVLHDCNPAHASIACPATSYADFRAQIHWWRVFLGWSGDVWKAIVHLRSTRHDLRIAVLGVRFWRRDHTKGISGIAIVLLGGADRGAQLLGSRRRPRPLA